MFLKNLKFWATFKSRKYHLVLPEWTKRDIENLLAISKYGKKIIAQYYPKKQCWEFFGDLPKPCFAQKFRSCPDSQTF